MKGPILNCSIHSTIKIYFEIPLLFINVLEKVQQKLIQLKTIR